ncbi:fas apoptotic inhibitory molecule 1-like protein [Dinothrombium tinctorium]|uniref:Fas apoptotic inhibitory molecule 1-like protein n=1 Tax=Dinothrombium tinctorium TaxID=1965070 RepID=A0A443R984_9ACAR|nr:fas apoptotic inhibitory molecule 1-like protein [Dinothrombium tinctorium]
MSDIAGVWDVPLSDKVHKVEFEHGTTTGKRVIRVDGEEVLRRDWMFKLVGKEAFTIGNSKCEIIITAASGFSYDYMLLVDGKQLKKFKDQRSKIMKAWFCELADKTYRIVLEKDTLDVWVNGEKKETTGEFVEDGTEIHFSLSDDSEDNVFIKTVSSGNKKEGIIYNLIVNGKEIAESPE